ncbi:MAG: hypothetical protein WDO56_17290 [Gammaproteobacteria bacterium]
MTYPTQTVAASTFLPDFANYQGTPLELGRMEPTVSDPSVQQQWGMRVGMPNAGGVNAIETLNIRGERSVTCKGKFDAPVSSGTTAERRARRLRGVRKQPDALEYARSSTRSTARVPTLKAMPMYCVVFAWKNWYDAKDMRGTGGNDVNSRWMCPRQIRLTLRICARKARSASR